jgi:hypothetical protein
MNNVRALEVRNEPMSPHAQAAIAGSDPVLAHDWTPTRMRAALRSHEAGRFLESAALCDAFDLDAFTSGVLRDRVEAALGLPYCTDFSEETTNRQRAIQLAFEVDQWWFEAFPEGTLAEVLHWRVRLGFCLGVIEWQELRFPNGRREWRPCALHIVHPSRVEYVALPVGDDEPGWYVTPWNGTRFRVTPGDGEWFLTTMGGPRPWMRGLVRPIAKSWLGADYAERDWNRRLEVEGIGVRKAYVPDDADPKHVAKYRDRVSRLGVETTLVLPRKKKDEGYDFEMTAADINAAHGFQSRIDHSHMNIAIASLGQNLTTKIEGGSYAAADVHKRVKNDLLKSDVAGLSTDCRGQIIKPWGRRNKPDWLDELAPWNRWDATPPEDRQPKAQTLLTLSQAIPGLQAVGVDLEPILEDFDLELLPEDERPDPAPAPTGTQKPTDQAPPPAPKPASLTL